MSPRTMKTMILFCILIGIHQTVRAHVHAGVYIIQHPNVPIANIDRFKITIDNTKLSISGGCNHLSTNYSVSDGHIIYKEWVST
jgi:hypothetical protein